MDRLWTPWRFQYVSSASREDGCIFCRILSSRADRENLILLRGEHSFLILNLFPYTVGHLMVVTNRHVSKLSALGPEELREVMESAQRCERILEEVYNAQGFNVGFNIGKSAGAGVAGHLHLHVIPRWTADVNLVTAMGETRIIPEDLRTTYEKLQPHFDAEAPQPTKTAKGE